jgi:multidrug efflux pump subunit AcrA (membrane-fusion protein)
VRVRTGERLGALVELLEGVAAGDRVVVDGAGFLGDGDRVRVVASPPTGAAPE